MNPQYLREHAARLFTSGKFEKAANCYRELLRLEPKDPAVHLRHAEACRRADRLHDALGSLGQAASLYADAGELPQARAALKQALELQPVPSHPDVRTALWKLEGLSEEKRVRTVQGVGEARSAHLDLQPTAAPWGRELHVEGLPAKLTASAPAAAPAPAASAQSRAEEEFHRRLAEVAAQVDHAVEADEEVVLSGEVLVATPEPAPAAASEPEAVRIDDRTVAVRLASGGWMVVSAATPLQVGRMSGAELGAALAVRNAPSEPDKGPGWFETPSA